MSELVQSYYQGGSELASWLEANLPILSQSPTVHQLDTINEYLLTVQKILSEIHRAIHEHFSVPLVAVAGGPPVARGDLRFLVGAYYRHGMQLLSSLQQNLPLLAAGASINLLDELQASIDREIEAISGTLRLIHEVLQANLLDREVLRYRFVLRMAEVVEQGLDRRFGYEARSILERWLLNLANDKQPGDAIFSLPKLEEHYPATEKMRSEFREKKIDPSQRVPLVLQLGREYLTVTLPPRVRKCQVAPSRVEVSEFNFSYPRARLELLSSLAPASAICPMVVRYACLLPRGQQWSLPDRVYEYLVDYYGVTVEGFASPLNSRIITLGRPGLSFCSLFPDTDAPFGSIGDFFEVDLIGRSVVVNPPFVPAVMDRMLLKIERDCAVALAQQASIRFFVVVPEWADAEFYLGLMKSPYRLFDFQLPGGSYHYLDLEGGRIPVKFNSHIFVVGTQQGNYQPLRTQLLQVYELS